MTDDPSDEARVVASVRDAMYGNSPEDAASRAAFDALLRRHRPKVYGVILKVVGNPELAAELTQETLLTAYRKLPDYQGRSRFGTWMCGIGHYLALNAVRRHGELLTDDGVLDSTAADQPAFRTLTSMERATFVQESAKACLDQLEQEVVYLRYEEGMPVDRITETLSLEGKTSARAVLQRSRRKLSREMERRLLSMGHGTSFVRTTTG